MARTVFYLVRHAHADWTPDENRPLSHQGVRDACRVADLLQQRPIGAIYASPMRRARQTVAPLAARLGLPVQVEPGLQERRLGGGPELDFLQGVEATWRDPLLAHPGGESNATAQQRGLAVVRRLQERHAEAQVVLATHGNLLALILQGFDPAIDLAFWKSLTMPDVYALCLGQAGETTIERLWRDPS
jgi:2,3-bisphosphoglycerate-dependent phosphoglycerate mutase